MYPMAAIVIGGLITIQNGINSLLSRQVGSLGSAIVIHLVGLATVSLVLLAPQKRYKTGKHPLYLYLGGVIGVGTIFACNETFYRLGASLAVALALFGQLAGSLIIDTTGFLGRQKCPPKARTLPGLGAILLGIILMMERGKLDLGGFVLGLVSGLLPLFSVILNSQLALEIGIFKSVRANFLTGFATTILVAFASVISGARPSHFSIANSLQILGATNPLIIVGGGVIGVMMVGAINFVYPKLPALHATLLMFAGQALAGLAVDAILSNGASFEKLSGTLMVISGLIINATLERMASRRSRAGIIG